MENNKIYHYGDNYYSIDELYSLYTCISYDKKKAFKDCLCHYILSEIFKKAGLNNSDILAIANIEYQLMNSKLPKINKFINKKIYSLYLKKIFGLKSIVKKYKVSEFINGEWILNKIISQTLGSGTKQNIIDDFVLIDYPSLTKEECIAVVKNFKRNINDENFVFYHSIKELKK